MEIKNHSLTTQRYLFSLLLLVTSLILQPVYAALPDVVNGKPLPTLAPILEDVMPGVVNVATRGRVQMQQNPLFDDPFFRHFFGTPNGPRERETQSLGSGVIIDARNGYIMTNHHVIAKADEITVTLRDGRKLEAKLVGADPDSDVAIIQVKEKNLTAIPLADSDQLNVGDFVVAIGNPFGLGQTVTSGIVSALGRGIGLKGYENFIQTDASINPGNSGGALIAVDGRLVGINSAIFSKSGGSLGIGFAIPSNMVRAVIAGVTRGGGRVVRPWLGTSGQDVTADIALSLGLKRPGGVLINDIQPDSPAAKAGIKVGDVVLAIDGHEVVSAEALRYRIATHAVGETATFTVLNGEQEREVRLALVEPPEIPARNITELTGVQPLAGAVVANMSPALAQEMSLSRFEYGVYILNIRPRSNASQFRFHPGDRVLSVNGTPANDVSGLVGALKAAGGDWVINIRRGGEDLSLRVSR